MILQTSWTALFNWLTLMNKSGNRNIAGFTGPMDFEANLNIKMMRLNQPLCFLLMANNSKEVTIIHHPNNFGGTTLLHPTDKVGCLVGTGPNATPVVHNHQSALQSVQAIVPPSRTLEPASRLTRLQPLSSPPQMGSST
jgi:hypothetical protein